MQHLDEGMLHAFLDGALRGDGGETPESQHVEQHLSVCLECQAKLEAARLLREDAATILAGAGPVAVVKPSFEELQARAESRGHSGDRSDRNKTAGQRLRLYRMKSLAWAATVVLAVAVGWIARSTILPDRQDQYASEGEAGGRIMIPVPDMETTNNDTIDDRDQSQPPNAIQEDLPADPQLDEARDEGAVSELGGVLAPAAEREEIPVARRGAVTTGAGAEARQVQPEALTASRVRQQVAAEGVPAAPSLAQAVNASLNDAGLVWKIVDEATAAAILEAPVPAIDGFPVVGYATSALNGRQAVRVQQSLETGELLELVITVGAEVAQSVTAKKGVESIDAPAGARGESINSVAIQRGGLNIRLSAALGVDSLHTLSDLVRSGR